MINKQVVQVMKLLLNIQMNKRYNNQISSLITDPIMRFYHNQ